MIFGLPVFPALAQDTDLTAEQLREAEKALEKNRAKRDSVASQANKVRRDIETIRKDMITTAKDIQDQEHSLTVIEGRITNLENEARELTKTLGRRDKQMSKVLLALERLALRPQDALTLHPLAPGDAVRSAILLRAAVPHIKDSAAKLQTELAGLYRVRREIIDQRARVATGAADLLNKRQHLELLAGEKKAQQAALISQQSILDRRVTEMAQEAQDLRELFENLAEEKRRKLVAKRAAAEERARSQFKEGRIVLKPPLGMENNQSNKEGRIVLKPPPGMENNQSNTDETQVSALPPNLEDSAETAARQARLREQIVTRSFAKARGTMPFPIAGNLTEMYGAATATTETGSLRARGITIQGRSGAQVVAPFDGIVAFAGPFRGYGRLLIIEHSEGYHTLLAGLGHIDSRVGQMVLAGEPIGTMENSDATSLYVELRRDGQPINPLPWLASRAEKRSG